MLRKITYGITGFNLLMELAYLTIGRMMEPGVLEYVFYVFHPTVWLLSGPVTVVLAVIFAVLLILGAVRKQFRPWDAGMLALNLQYLVFFFIMLSRQ